MINQFVFGLEIDSKESYSIGETALIKVSGNFVSPILEKNILIYRGGAKTASEISMENIEGEYYISSSLIDKFPGNYSMKITGASYLDGRQLITEEIIIPFSIINNTIEFSIFPGSIRTNNNFSVTVQNLKNTKIQLSISGWDSGLVYPEYDTYELKSGEIKKIKFYYKSSNKSLEKNILFSSENYSYYLPVYLEKDDKKTEEEKIEYSFDQGNIKINTTIGTKKTYFTYLKNTGEKDIENISLIVSEEISEYISLLINESFDLEKNSSIKVEIYLDSPTEEKSISGKIRAVDDLENYAYLYLDIISTKEYIPLNLEENITLEDDIQEIDPEEGTTSKVVGWIIIVILLIIIGWFFFKKYGHAGMQKIDLLKIAKGKPRLKL